MKLSHRELDRVNSPEKIQLRKEYALWFNNHFNNDFSRAIFIDESSFKELKPDQSKGLEQL